MRPTSRRQRNWQPTTPHPSSDLRGPAEYKKGLVKELTRRALARAYERVGK